MGRSMNKPPKIIKTMDRWDGPLSGYCLYEDNRCYFSHHYEGGMHRDANKKNEIYDLFICLPRVYKIYELSEEGKPTTKHMAGRRSIRMLLHQTDYVWGDGTRI